MHNENIAVVERAQISAVVGDKSQQRTNVGRDQPVSVLGLNENEGKRASRSPARNCAEASRNAATNARHPFANVDRAARVAAKQSGMAERLDILG